MNFSQLVSPNLNQKTNAGWCLKFTQDSFRAPVMHASATIAANATKMRNSSLAMPNVAVPVWFDHWGTYQGVYANWGHVVVWVPGKGFLSSPMYGFGQQWFSSLEAVERSFNAKYRFWSLDINTLQVAKTAPVSPTPSPGQEEDDDMAVNSGIYWEVKSGGAKPNTWSYATYNMGSGFFAPFGNGDGSGLMPGAYNNELAGSIQSAPWAKVTESHAGVIERACAAVRSGK